MKRVSALVVEDEPLARQALRDRIEAIDWLQLTGEAADGLEAIERIDRLEPDLVFLDIHLPGASGLEVLERIRHRPYVVFTTAYERYAVQAFELEAIDYLLKPFSHQRFQSTLERVHRRLATTEEPVVLDRLRSALGGGPLRRLYGRRGDRIVPVALDEVSRFEASEERVTVHARGLALTVGLTLGELAERLDAERFVRVHRAHIVNLDQVVTMRPFDGRRLLIRLRDGSEVVASRAGSERLRRRSG